jgi:hypothetical protein
MMEQMQDMLLQATSSMRQQLANLTLTLKQSRAAAEKGNTPQYATESPADSVTAIRAPQGSGPAQARSASSHKTKKKRDHVSRRRAPSPPPSDPPDSSDDESTQSHSGPAQDGDTEDHGSHQGKNASDNKHDQPSDSDDRKRRANHKRLDKPHRHRRRESSSSSTSHSSSSSSDSTLSAQQATGLHARYTTSTKTTKSPYYKCPEFQFERELDMSTPESIFSFFDTVEFHITQWQRIATQKTGRQIPRPTDAMIVAAIHAKIYGRFMDPVTRFLTEHPDAPVQDLQQYLLTLSAGGGSALHYCERRLDQIHRLNYPPDKVCFREFRDILFAALRLRAHFRKKPELLTDTMIVQELERRLSEEERSLLVKDGHYSDRAAKEGVTELRMMETLITNWEMIPPSHRPLLASGTAGRTSHGSHQQIAAQIRSAW